MASEQTELTKPDTKRRCTRPGEAYRLKWYPGTKPRGFDGIGKTRDDREIESCAGIPRIGRLSAY